MAERNQHKDNFTDLAETYMYGRPTDRINFYQYYKNNENSIDDPIFTGFTFDIDRLHSPLFYTVSEYDDSTTLRSSGGTDAGLSGQIEENLNDIYKRSITATPDSYELSTIYAKGLISSEQPFAGYGLQDKFYIDNVVYGATEYIYMVDKVTSGMYTDDAGATYNVGNGTPNTSTYDTNEEKLQSVKDMLATAEAEVTEEEKKQEAAKAAADGTKKKKDKKTKEKKSSSVTDVATGQTDEAKLKQAAHDKEVTNNINKQLEDKKQALLEGKKISGTDTTLEEDHQKNLNAITEITGEPDADGKTNLDKQLEERAKLVTDHDNMTEQFDNDKMDLKAELANLKGQAESLLTMYKSNYTGHTTIDGDYISYSDAIERLYAKFSEYKTQAEKGECEYNGKKVTHTVKFSEVGSKDFDKKKKELSDEESSSYNEKKTTYETAWKIICTQILNTTIKKEVKAQYDKLNADIKSADTKLYGAKGSESNPDPSSTMGQLAAARNKAATDEYSQTIQEITDLEDTLANMDDINAYEDYKKENNIQKSEYTLNPPSLDPMAGESESAYAARYEEAMKEFRKNTERKISEVPQTVYDILGFIKGMKKLTSEYPYVMDSVSGLDEAYKKYFSMKEPFQGSGDDKITITCYESLDLRISSMLNKYFNAVYDHQYKRERVPLNLRRFQCSIFVHDIRNFRSSVGKVNSHLSDLKNGDDVESKIVEIALNYVSAIEFRFYDCEIVPEETGALFDSVSNETGGDMKKTNFTFTYGNCVINFLPFEDLKKYYKMKSGGLIRRADKTYGYDGQGSKSRLDDTDTNDNINQDFRRWFDKSGLGNVNNNDYRDYVRTDSNVAVDDHYKTTIVNSFALGSVVDKNKEMTEMDDALRRILVGISASTGIPAKGVADSLNIGNIYDYINKGDGSDMPIVRGLGNATNAQIVGTNTTIYTGGVVVNHGKVVSPTGTTETISTNNNTGGNEVVTSIGKLNNQDNEEELDIIKDLGKI